MHYEEGQTRREGASIGTLLGDFSRELSSLVRQEIQLVKAEISEKISEAGAGVGSIAIGGAVLFAGFLILLLAIVNGLNEMMAPTSLDHPWISPLIVGGIVLAIGIGLLVKGRHNLKADALVPRMSRDSLRRDTEVLREQLK